MKFIIDTDLSVEGTSISMDGEKLSDSRKIANLAFFAEAPNKKYNDDGYIAINVTSFDDEGVMKRESFSKRPEMAENIKPIGLQDGVEFAESDVIRFLGDEIEQEKKQLVDSIIKHCSEKEIACPNSEVLLNRSLDSIKDKATDLGLSSVES